MSPFKGVLYCIHGFLGQSTDWVNVLPADVQAVKLDLFSQSESAQRHFDFDSLSAWINQKAGETASPRVLVGYSFGGRIALNALVVNPELWAAAVIISAHPGLSEEQDRVSRIKADEKWAKRFEGDPWDQVLADWNSQSVLQGSHLLDRRESDFSRKALVASLRESSLGRQKDLREKLRRVETPILWIVGENDQKFLAIAREMEKLNPRISLVVLPNSSHRAAWDQPELFKGDLTRFLDLVFPSSD